MAAESTTVSAAASSSAPEAEFEASAVEVKDLTFDLGGPNILESVNLVLPAGSRTLLVGANGAGKTTLLRVLAGKRLSKGGVSVFGKDPFRQGVAGITYLGTEWASNPIVRRDMLVSQLVQTMGGDRYPERRDHLVHILDVNLQWRMHQVSDGERRRVQILLGVLEPFRLLLLDEVTVDLDVLVRRDLLDFLRAETQGPQRATILYATHIFDGIGTWPTHIARVRSGTVLYTRQFPSFSADDSDAPSVFPELEAAKARSKQSPHLWADSPLLQVVEQWLREDLQLRRQQGDTQNGVKAVATRWDALSEDMKTHGDRFYNYWK